MANLKTYIYKQPFAMMSGILVGLMLVNLYISVRANDTNTMWVIPFLLIITFVPLFMKVKTSKTCQKSEE